jgi:cytoskeletal protein CcmA (bactofilin family)
MALWNQPSSKESDLKESPKQTPPPMEAAVKQTERPEVVPMNREAPRPAPQAPQAARVADAARAEPARGDTKESLIASDLVIEGKIEGSGHVRIAGRFKGEVQVEGNVTIEAGAKVTGEVRAHTVIVGGELEGNIDAASRVELLQTGIINGDVKAGSLTVAAGSRMRGRAEFGWDEKLGAKVAAKVGGAAV